MSDRIGVREIYLGLTNQPGQLSLAISPWVGAMSIGGDGLRQGSKGR